MSLPLAGRAPIAWLWPVPIVVLLAVLPMPAIELALLALCGAALAMAAIRRPAIGLGLAALAVPFGRLAFPGAGALAAPLALALAAAGTAIHARRSATPTAPWSGLDRALALALAGYLAVHAASAWRAPALEAAAAESARWLELALAGGLAALLADRRDRAGVALAMLAAGTVATGVGAWLALTGYGPDAYTVGGRGFTRAHWPFGQPNPFGGYVNLVWPLAAAWIAMGIERGQWRRSAMLVAPVAMIAVIGLGLSWSRGAWLAAVAGGTLMALAWSARGLWARRPGRLVAPWAATTAWVALALVGALRPPAGIAARLASIAGDAPDRSATVLGLPDVAEAEVTDASFATVERLAHWQAAGAMWSERPWLGQGPGHYALAYPRFRLGQWSEPLGHAHNYYLHALAETGLLGLASYGALLALALAVGLRSALAPRGGMEEVLGLALVGALGATAVHSLFDNLWVHELPIHVGLLAGLTIASRRAP